MDQALVSSRNTLSAAEVAAWLVRDGAPVRLVPRSSAEMVAIRWNSRASMGAAPRRLPLVGDDVFLHEAAPLSTAQQTGGSTFLWQRRPQRDVVAVLRLAAGGTWGRVGATYRFVADLSTRPPAWPPRRLLRVLQKVVIDWLVASMADAPRATLTIAAVERAFPCLAALSPPRRRVFLESALETFAEGRLLWFDDALVRAGPAGPLRFPAVSRAERRACAAFELALGNARAASGGRPAEALRAVALLVRRWTAGADPAGPPVLLRCLLLALQVVAPFVSLPRVRPEARAVVGSHLRVLLLDAATEEAATLRAELLARRRTASTSWAARLRQLVWEDGRAGPPRAALREDEAHFFAVEEEAAAAAAGRGLAMDPQTLRSTCGLPPRGTAPPPHSVRAAAASAWLREARVGVLLGLDDDLAGATGEALRLVVGALSGAASDSDDDSAVREVRRHAGSRRRPRS